MHCSREGSHRFYRCVRKKEGESQVNDFLLDSIAFAVLTSFTLYLALHEPGVPVTDYNTLWAPSTPQKMIKEEKDLARNERHYCSIHPVLLQSSKSLLQQLQTWNLPLRPSAVYQFWPPFFSCASLLLSELTLIGLKACSKKSSATKRSIGVSPWRTRWCNIGILFRPAKSSRRISESECEAWWPWSECLLSSKVFPTVAVPWDDSQEPTSCK